jgi:hypothetical protein
VELPVSLKSDFVLNTNCYCVVVFLAFVRSLYGLKELGPMFNRPVSLLKIRRLYFSGGLNLDSLVSIVSKLRAGRFSVRIPAGTGDFSLL